MKKNIILIFIFITGLDASAEIRIGAAKRKITPEEPVWMAGYASRPKPSEGVLQDIWVKAVVIEENSKSRLVIVTSDILGFSHQSAEAIIKKIMKAHGVERSQILLNSSHTHSGPVIWPTLSLMYPMNESEMLTVIRYTRKLTDHVAEAVGEAFRNLTPGSIVAGHGSAGFAINRRQLSDKGIIIGSNSDGPVDHDVPVVKFMSSDGRILAVLFGYACHNTTLNTQEINGDYAGFAQSGLEEKYTGAIAMYIAGCGADQNPDPRRSVELAKSHGKALADAVSKVLESGSMTPVRTPIRTAYTSVDLPFPEFSTERYYEEFEDEDTYRKKRAKFLLEAYDRGYDMNSLSYPVQAVRFNKDFTIVALGGEVVVDYSLNTRKKYPNENLFVAGYSTEVLCYIPSRRILKEGGYEPDNSMIYYGLPGPFREDVEDKVLSAIDLVLKKTGAKPAKTNR